MMMKGFWRMNEVEVLHLFKLYTTMARELCHSMYQVLPDDQKPIVSHQQASTHFEWLFDLIYDLELCKLFVIYCNTHWTWDLHGEHCLFESDQGIQIEANIYNTDFVDIAFFNVFIKSYTDAHSLFESIEDIDFKFTATLFDQWANKNILQQQSGTEFSLVHPIDH